MWFRALTFLLVLSTSACSSWVYRLDIPQGNFIEKKNIDKLQMAMTKEQVKFLLGSPVIKDSFDNDTWYYIYRFKSGKNENINLSTQFIITFEDNKIASTEGTYTLPESFYTPIQHE